MLVVPVRGVLGAAVQDVIRAAERCAIQEPAAVRPIQAVADQSAAEDLDAEQVLFVVRPWLEPDS